MLLKEMVEKAKNGDKFYKQYLYKKYYYVAKKIHKKHEEELSLIDVLKIYKNILDEYIRLDIPIGISAYLVSKFEIVFKNTDNKEREYITDIIKRAKDGDENSRNKLINRYSYIVEKYAKQYKYMEYDDLVQYGMVKLIEFIDYELSVGDGSLFSPQIIKVIKYYFSNTLKNEVETHKIDFEQGYILNNYNFHEKVFEMELEELINTKNISEKDRLCALKYFIEKLSLTQIGEIYDCSKQVVSLRVNKVAQKLKSEYTK